MEEEAARIGVRPDARVFLAVGELESSMMAGDLLELAKNLRGRSNPLLQLSTKVFEGERHNSVFPGAVTRGLLTVFDRPTPANPTPQSDRAR
jgi:hypothetical protein